MLDNTYPDRPRCPRAQVVRWARCDAARGCDAPALPASKATSVQEAVRQARMDGVVVHVSPALAGGAETRDHGMGGAEQPLAASGPASLTSRVTRDANGRGRYHRACVVTDGDESTTTVHVVLPEVAARKQHCPHARQSSPPRPSYSGCERLPPRGSSTDARVRRWGDNGNTASSVVSASATALPHARQPHVHPLPAMLDNTYPDRPRRPRAQVVRWARCDAARGKLAPPMPYSRAMRTTAIEGVEARAKAGAGASSIEQPVPKTGCSATCG